MTRRIASVPVCLLSLSLFILAEPIGLVPPNNIGERVCFTAITLPAWRSCFDGRTKGRFWP